MTRRFPATHDRVSEWAHEGRDLIREARAPGPRSTRLARYHDDRGVPRAGQGVDRGQLVNWRTGQTLSPKDRYRLIEHLRAISASLEKTKCLQSLCLLVEHLLDISHLCTEFLKIWVNHQIGRKTPTAKQHSNRQHHMDVDGADQTPGLSIRRSHHMTRMAISPMIAEFI